MLSTDPMEQMKQEMLDRRPQYPRVKKVMLAYIAAIERPGGLFTWAPMVDGKAGYLAPAVEERCGKAVVRELKKCIKEIDAHVNRARDL